MCGWFGNLKINVNQIFYLIFELENYEVTSRYTAATIFLEFILEAQKVREHTDVLGMDRDINFYTSTIVNSIIRE